MMRKSELNKKQDERNLILFCFREENTKDDFKVTVKPINIIQRDEYYPFGLQTVNSWTRDNTAANNFLYNQATELNATTGIYDTFFRGYDPALGRFMQIDPIASRYSSHTPYNYSFNSPLLHNDPSGADPYNDIWNIIETLWRSTPEEDGVGMWTGNGGNFSGGGSSGSYHYYKGDGSGNYNEVGGTGVVYQKV